MTRSTMNFALMDPVARALDDLMNQGFDLDEILRVSGGITSGGGHSPAADIAPTRNADSDYQMNSDDHQDASFAVSIHESESDQSLPSCHHCGIAPKTPQQLLSEMLRCEHHLCGAVFHTECLRVAHSKGSHEGGAVMFCPACAQRLEDNARVLSLHSIEVISRPPMLGVGSSSGGSSSSWANEGGVIFSKHTVGAGSGATSSFGNGLFIAGAAQSSGESKEEWNSRVASVLKVPPRAAAPPIESSSSSSSAPPGANSAGRVANNRRKWRGTDESSSSFL